MEKDMLFSGESVNVEYKVAVPKDSAKYMKTVVAYANGRGGKIIFGVDDKTLEVVGMDTDSIFQTIDAITNAISDSCEPTIRHRGRDIPRQDAAILYQVQGNGQWYVCPVGWNHKAGGRLHVERADSGRPEPLL